MTIKRFHDKWYGPNHINELDIIYLEEAIAIVDIVNHVIGSKPLSDADSTVLSELLTNAFETLNSYANGLIINEHVAKDECETEEEMRAKDA